MIWEYKELIEHKDSTQVCINGEWVAVRPLNYKYRSIKEKIKECYLLWIGKTESFRWPEGQ